MSKKPHYESYMWGPKYSIFAKTIFTVFYFIRFLSPLQFLKQTYRYFDNSKVEKKDRSDFHAYHTELYLLTVFLFVLLNYYYNILNIELFWTKIVLLIFLIESIFWMLYYMLFRVLMEKHLNIYNAAEYFVCLPIAFITQAILISTLVNLKGLSALKVIIILFSLGDANITGLSPNIEILLRSLGFLYTAVIIGNVVGLMPPLPIQKRQNISVIGAGDVVEHRILDALLDLYKPNQLSIISFDISNEFQKVLKQKKIYFEIKKNMADIVKSIKQRSSFAIIATPTQYHYPYMISLANEGIPFAVEKPITNFKPYLLELKSNNKLMEHGFLLSYYWLEKAITLNYFLTLNPIYKKYIHLEEPKDLKEKFDNEDLGFLELVKNNLGPIKEITINLLEGDEKNEREWSLEEENGGMVFETLIHPMTLLYHATDKKIDFNIKDLTWKRSNNKDITGVEITGNIDGCDFNIDTDKFVNKKRFMEIIYEHGEIYLDLESRTCHIKSNRGNNLTLKINEDYALNYEVQFHLVDNFIQNNSTWNGIRFDDYPDQVDLLLYMYDNIYRKYLDYSSETV